MLPRGFRTAFRLAPRGRDAQAKEIDEEIAFHIQERIDALVDRGWSISDATAEAARRFGDLATERRALVAVAQQRDRQLTLFEWIDALRTDLRVAARRLRYAPTFAFGTIAAFALGIGANATMFNVIDRLLLRPPAQVAGPQDVYTIHALPRDAISFPAFIDLRDHLAGAASVSAQTMGWPLPIGRGDEAAYCLPTFFVDGIEWNVKMGPPVDLTPGRPAGAPFTPTNVKGVEVYPSERNRPLRFLGDPTCGAIVIWTK